MLRKHLQRLEQPLEDEDEPESAHDMIPDEAYIEDDAKGIYALLFKIFCIGSIYIFILVDMYFYIMEVRSVDESFSPEPIRENQEAEDEAGSFSPQLLHDDESEEAIDPEEDRAILVIFLNIIINDDPMLIL